MPKVDFQCLYCLPVTTVATVWNLSIRHGSDPFHSFAQWDGKRITCRRKCHYHICAFIIWHRWGGGEGRLESRLKRHTWRFLHKDDFGVLQKVMTSQYHFFPSSNRKAVGTLLLHQRQFLGRSLSWRVIKKIFKKKRQPQTHKKVKTTLVSNLMLTLTR